MAGIRFVLYQDVRCGSCGRYIKFFITVLYIGTQGELLGIGYLRCYNNGKISYFRDRINACIASLMYYRHSE